MPSSLIFASLVVLWLLILLPTVARRRSEVPHPSTAALSGRVLRRPARHRIEGVDDVPSADTGRADTGRADTGQAEPDEPAPDDGPDDVRAAADAIVARWERPAPRYRPGRGGFDPAAAAVAAQSRYHFRQRVVLALLVTAALTAAAALLLGPMLWWVHAGIDAMLVGYLVYLRRQVRLEDAIRQRRSARMAGTHRPAAAEDPALDEWARRGRDAVARPVDESEDGTDLDAGAPPHPAATRLEPPPVTGKDGDDDGPTQLAGPADPADIDGSTVPATSASAPPVATTNATPEPAEDPEPEPALPTLAPRPPPSIPSGTTLLDDDDIDPDLPAFDPAWRPYRRAAGQ